MDVYLKGVYFLFQNDTVVYIGKSNDIYRRIYEHSSGRAKGPKKDFDSWEYVKFDDEESMARFESACIHAFRPKYNIVDTGYTVVNYPKRKPHHIQEFAKVIFDYASSISTDDLDGAALFKRGTFHTLIKNGAIPEQAVINTHRAFGGERILTAWIVDNIEKLYSIKEAKQ